MTTADPPEGLQTRGCHFWIDTVSSFDLSDAEQQLLTEVCRTLDNLDDLAEVIERDGATTKGSMGQTVVHPALTEARGQRLVLHRLLAALQLPDEDGQTISTATQTRATTASRARWQRTGPRAV